MCVYALIFFSRLGLAVSVKVLAAATRLGGRMKTGNPQFYGKS